MPEQGQGHPPLAAALLPLVATLVAYGLSIRLGLVPACNPFIEGCVSISRAARHDLPNILFRALLLADPSEKPDVNAYVDVDLKTNPARRLRVELRDHPAQRFDGTQPAETDKVRIAQISCPARANCAQSSFPALDVNPATGAIMFHRKGAPARYNEAPLPLDLIRIEWKGKTEF